ncbi:MAG TPA: prolyl oligopeptidase family serine peptidase [Caulobacteraceae bacterium]
MTQRAAATKARLGAYPQARQQACVELRHGVAVPDPFRGLEGDETGEVAAWCDAEQALTDAVLGASDVRGAVAGWLGRFLDAPCVFHTLEAGRTRFMLEDRPDADQPALIVRDLDTGRERLLIDPAELRDGDAPLILVQEAIFPSPTGRFVAVYVKPPGDINRLQVRRVDTGEIVAADFPVTVLPNLSWSPDESGFFYNQNQGEFVPAELRSGRADGIYRHELAQAPADDELVVPMLWPHAHAAIPTVSPDGRFLFVNLIQLVANRSALYALSLAAGGAAPVELCEAGAGSFGFVGQAGERCYFETDLGAADRGRVVAFDMSGFPRPAMTEAVAEQARPLARSIRNSCAEKAVLAGHTLCLTYIDRAAHQIALFDLAGRHIRDVAMPMPCSVASGGGDRYGRMSLGADGRLLVDLWTFAQTPASYAYDLEADAWSLVATDRPPRALDDVDIWQVEYPAADGEPIPATILARRTTPRDGSAPCLLYGYGAAGMAITPEFGLDIVAWLALGGVYVIANVRGGGEKGESWREPARGLNAQVSFDDFLAGAEHLIAEGLAWPERLAVRGLSAGGLLVAAAITQKPALFGAAILEAPLVDPLSIGRDYWSEQIAIESGNPTRDPVAFAAIRRFSPLQALRAGPPYPSTFVTIGDRDAQLLLDGARKFSATLQSFDQPGALHLFHILRNAGHGAWTVSQLIEIASREMAFLALTLDAPLDPARLTAAEAR